MLDCQPHKHLHDERGYALLALLSAMAVLMILLAAAAPVIKHEAQRDRELEAIRRGEQVADAIREYMTKTNGTFPQSMEQLLEGAPNARGSKKIQVLRPSSARDPLVPEGEWRLVKPAGDKALNRFCTSVIEYSGAIPVPDPNTTLPALAGLYQSACTNPLPIGDDDVNDPEPKVGEPGSDSGPFVGVISSSRSESIVNYYGIDSHNRWVFTPLFR